MSRVIKVKDKEDESSKQDIKVGDLITFYKRCNKCLLLVTALHDDGKVDVLVLRYASGKIVRNLSVKRRHIAGYVHYRGKLTIKQE